MHINQFTVNKRLIGMYFKYPWGSLGFPGVHWGSLGLKDMRLTGTLILINIEKKYWQGCIKL